MAARETEVGSSAKQQPEIDHLGAGLERIIAFQQAVLIRSPHRSHSSIRELNPALIVALETSTWTTIKNGNEPIGVRHLATQSIGAGTCCKRLGKLYLAIFRMLDPVANLHLYPKPANDCRRGDALHQRTVDGVSANGGDD